MADSRALLNQAAQLVQHVSEREQKRKEARAQIAGEDLSSLRDGANFYTKAAQDQAKSGEPLPELGMHADVFAEEYQNALMHAEKVGAQSQPVKMQYQNTYPAIEEDSK